MEFMAFVFQTAGWWVILAMSVAISAHYWADSQYPLATIQVPLVEWLYMRSSPFLQVLGKGLDCGKCSGQWIAFLAVGVSVAAPWEDPVRFLAWSLSLNMFNVAARSVLAGDDWVTHWDEDEDG